MRDKEREKKGGSENKNNKLYSFHYYFVKSFENEISEIINNSKNNKKINIFDIGSFRGNFSRNIKKKIKKKANFFLFDPNPKIALKDFTYNCFGVSDKNEIKKYNYNSFAPSSGSGYNNIVSNDFFWVLTRKIFTFNFFKELIIYKTKTVTLDTFCKKKKIKEIELLKIDTEGHEMNVLNGAKSILKKTKIIQVEILSKKKIFQKKFIEIDKFLKRYHFKLLKIKRIWSTSIFSNIKAIDALYIKI